MARTTHLAVGFTALLLWTVSTLARAESETQSLAATSSIVQGAPIAKSTLLQWEELPALPDAVGFAGSASGVTSGALVVAGGANFPSSPPWDGTQKVWHDRIFVLSNPHESWVELSERLHRPIAYSVSITTEKGVALLGGSDGRQHFADCRMLVWQQGKLTLSSLPSLPRPCAYACGALWGNTICVAGGSEHPDSTEGLHSFWELDLSDIERGWQTLAPWPGRGRFHAVAGVQDNAFFLMGGTALTSDSDGKPVRESLRDAYRYTRKSGWRRISNLPRQAIGAPTPAPNVGQSHLLILGGVESTRVGLTEADNWGISRSVLAYHTITDTWVQRGTLPFSLVTTPVVNWNGRFVVPGGEERPKVRSTKVWSAQTVQIRAAFGWLNLLTLMAYPVCMLAIAWACALRNKNSNDYFRASGCVPWWAAGISIYATMLSSLTYMAVPANAFQGNWALFLGTLSLPLLTPMIVRVYLPYFRRLNVTSAYEFLEQRFSLAIRWFGSASFIVFQFGRTGIVLFLPALALSTVSSLNMTWCIVGMGILTMLLTVFGGIQAVVWTDVAQTIILLGAIAVSLIILLLRADGGAVGLVSSAHEHHKFFESVSWTSDLTLATGWVVFVGMAFNNFISYTSNQEVVQRYMTTPSLAQAGRAVWTNALMSLPMSALFFGVGTALFVFYRQHPDRLDPTLPNDAIFPLFMLHELPAGIAGFVVAGIFAAAQPTSGLNSTAAAIVSDFYCRIRHDASDREQLVAGRLATIATGVIGMGVALLAAQGEIRSVYEMFLHILGVTTGPLAGVFALGVFTTRANNFGALLGLLAGVSSIAFVSTFTAIHPLLYGVVGVLATFCCGYALSVTSKGKSHTLAETPAWSAAVAASSYKSRSQESFAVTESHAASQGNRRP